MVEALVKQQVAQVASARLNVSYGAWLSIVKYLESY